MGFVGMKNIEEMAKKFCRNADTDSITCKECVSNNLCSCKLYAERLVDASYGNVAQAVKEFAEKLKDKILSLHCCDMATTEHEYYDMALSDVTYDIDNLFKELYGEGKE